MKMFPKSGKRTRQKIRKTAFSFLLEVWTPSDGRDHLFGDVAPLPEESRPQLDPDDAEDEEDEEAEQQDVPQHGQGVQE